MSLSAVPLVGRHGVPSAAMAPVAAAMAGSPEGRCSPSSVLIVAKMLKYPFSLGETDPFTVAIAIRSIGKHQPANISPLG